MTTADVKNEKRNFFSIYKPSQGVYVRWGTVAGAGIVILTGAAWLGYALRQYTDSIAVQATTVCIWVAVLAFLTFWLVNSPRFAEFLIMTESEMRKVTWPSRREVMTSTKVVILLTCALGLLLWLVDAGFLQLFQALKIL